MTDPSTTPTTSSQTDSSLKSAGTGVEAGLAGQEQIRIALEAIADNGGVATMQQIYVAVEHRMAGIKLSEAGKASLRFFINNIAVKAGYVYPHDATRPGWRITPAGRELLALPPDQQGATLDQLGNDGEPSLQSEEDGEENGQDTLANEEFYDSLATWQRDIATSHPLGRQLADTFPAWVAEYFKGVVVFRGLHNQRFSLHVNGQRIMRGRINQSDGVYVWLQEPPADVIEQLRAQLMRPSELRPRERQGVSGWRFMVSSLEDYQLLQDATARMVAERADVAADLPRQPAIYAEEHARFWRIHFPREHWASAHQAGVIAIGWPLDSPNQSVKRFRQIAVGDRVVVYVQGGVVGGIGIVVSPFDLENPRAGLPGEVLDDQFTQAIRIAWADAPAEPVDLLDALRSSRYTSLYNRIKNPHTVMPLNRADYTTLLSLLDVDDAGPPPGDSRLPNVWPQLAPYLALARAIGDRSLDASLLQEAARAIKPSPTEPLDAEDLVTELLQLRLVEASGTSHYRARSYVAGDENALLRLCVLALLVPLEGSADQYALPARAILPRLRDSAEAQRAERFAPELNKADGATLLGWYAEAGLVDVDGDTWRPLDGALAPLAGGDGASEHYNLFLRALLADIAAERTLALPHVPADAALPPVEGLEARLRELGQELLFDSAVVRRVYRSLLAGRHVVLSGPPGTGKTELARRLPALLWREAPQAFQRLTLTLDRAPVEQVTEQRDGYASVVVTATEDWGVRDVVGGIGPRLDGQSGALSYTIEHGALTRVVLQHYDGTSEGRRLPPPAAGLVRRDYHSGSRRYRGAWLVIDEFTRAPIDAAFGSLLTTLSGGERATLAVPTREGELREVPLPRDFRIIGTLNSFDRHFLNQMSEAMKRRFDFIDVLPPPPRMGDFEQGIAAKEALRRMRDDGFEQIVTEGEPPAYRWVGVLRAEPTEDADGLRRYLWHADDPGANGAMTSFWRLFSAIRVFRQLGTAQMVAIYLNLLTGVRVGMPWDEALDTALADALADQLQVLSRDEQRTIDAVVEHAGQPQEFVAAVQAIVRELPPGRRAGYLYALRERDAAFQGTSDIAVREEATLSEAQLTRVFAVAAPLAVPRFGVFRQRLRDLVGERGL